MSSVSGENEDETSKRRRGRTTRDGREDAQRTDPEDLSPDEQPRTWQEVVRQRTTQKSLRRESKYADAERAKQIDRPVASTQAGTSNPRPRYPDMRQTELRLLKSMQLEPNKIGSKQLEDRHHDASQPQAKLPDEKQPLTDIQQPKISVRDDMQQLQTRLSEIRKFQRRQLEAERRKEEHDKEHEKASREFSELRSASESQAEKGQYEQPQDPDKAIKHLRCWGVVPLRAASLATCACCLLADLALAWVWAFFIDGSTPLRARPLGFFVLLLGTADAAVSAAAFAGVWLRRGALLCTFVYTRPFVLLAWLTMALVAWLDGVSLGKGLGLALIAVLLLVVAFWAFEAPFAYLKHVYGVQQDVIVLAEDRDATPSVYATPRTSV